MDFFKTQLARIQQQLSGLSASQKMLTACLVAIMVMTLVGWSHWAGEPDMVPVLDQSLSQNELGQMSVTLDGMGISHRVTDGKLYVPADRQVEVLASLGYSQALPTDFSDSFDTMIKNMSWLDPPSKTDRMFLQARTNMLTRVLRSFPGVATAAVTIDPTQQTRLDGNSIDPTASVALTTTRNGKADPKKLAQSAVYVLSGAQAGLQPANIKVVIDGVPIKTGDGNTDSGMGSDSFVDAQRENEDLYCENIYKLLDYIHGLKVSVHVKLNTESTTTNIHSVDPKQTVQVANSEKEVDTESHSATDAGQEAGAASNVGVSVSGGGGGGGANTSTNTETQYSTDYSTKNQVVHKGPGDSTVESASISVPRTYLIAEFKSRNKREPEEADLQTFATARFADIRQQVKSCTGIADNNMVSVNDYSDDLVLQADSQNEPENASVSPVTLTLTNHTKEIGVGMLAAVSLFMVSMIVRKSTPAPVLAEIGSVNEQQGFAPDALAKGDPNAMDGVELDDEAVKAQQVVDQVQQMVQTNPDGAATLVKRWMNR